MWRNLTLTLTAGIFLNFIHGNSYGVRLIENFSSLKISELSIEHLIKPQLEENIQFSENFEDISTPKTEESRKILNNTNSHPLFKFFPKILEQQDVSTIKAFVHNNGLGPDPSSSEFIEREKNIRFIQVNNDDFIPTERDYFIQPASYNDFSGGYKRYYKLIPNSILMGPMHGLIVHFIQYLQLPTNTTVLVQLQSSIIRANSTKSDVTGQGIHTDGADDAMLVCVERDNVIGAENEFHAALDGSQPLSKPRILEAGDGVVFRDNKIYHHVTDAETKVPVTRRTLILMHSPEKGEGVINPKNKQGTNKANIKLRNQQI